MGRKKVCNSRNGVSEPKPGTDGRKVWDLCDKGLTRSQVLSESHKQGISVGTASTRYNDWSIFHAE